MLTCACLVVPIVVAGGLHSVWIAVGLLSIAAAAHQGWSANIFTTASDMFPARYVGTVVSFGQVAGALGGAIFQPVAGHILQFTHSFVPLFHLFGVCLSGGSAAAANAGSRPTPRIGRRLRIRMAVVSFGYFSVLGERLVLHLPCGFDRPADDRGVFEGVLRQPSGRQFRLLSSFHPKENK